MSKKIEHKSTVNYKILFPENEKILILGNRIGYNKKKRGECFETNRKNSLS